MQDGIGAQKMLPRRLGASSGGGGGGGVEFPEAMVHWVAALELPESAASELLGFLCGTPGMRRRGFLDLESAHIEAALSHVPVAKKQLSEGLWRA